MSELGAPGGGANIIPAPPAGAGAGPKPGPRGVDAVRDILAGARAGEADADTPPTDGDPTPDAGASDLGIGQPNAEGAGAPDDSAKLSLNDLAEKAGVSLEELYTAELALPNDGGSISLEALKTNHTNAQRLEQRTQELDERTREFENQQIQTRQELTELLRAIPPEALKPEVLQAVAEQHKQALDANRAALLEIKPEWADTEVFQRAQDDIAGAVKDYGFTRLELESVVDYRLTKLLHDFAGLRKQVAEANALLKQVRSQGGSKATTSGPAADAPAPITQELRDKARQGNTTAQLEGVARILGQRK